VSAQEIHHYLKVNDQLIPGGQPSANHLKAIADEGFKVVINPATVNGQTH
jgi:protein tyrosine phosphatase (PTP) superfamily phosphohydrolase (DUF442 family)